MTTVMTTNNAYDSILLVSDSDRVLSAWTATPEVIATYLRDGADANNWETGSFFGPADACENISDYGVECGRNGKIDSATRREFWAVR